MWSALRRLMTANPMGMFIYGIITKWYLMITVAAVVVTFWVFKGLDKAGVLVATEQVVSKALSASESVAKYCVPQITKLEDFWHCLNNTPEYTPEADEKSLTERVKVLQEAIQSNSYDNNPYGSNPSDYVNPYKQ